MLKGMAQENPESPSLKSTLLSLEEQVWLALVDGNETADEALLCPDFLGVYPTGFAGREDHAGQLEQGPSVAKFRLSEVRCLPLGPDHAMLCYLAAYRRPGQSVDEAMYVSSLWRREGVGWRNLFSQDTPATDIPVP